jgi:hypothetical protein
MTMNDWNPSYWVGARLKDHEGKDFLLLKIDWHLIPDDNKGQEAHLSYSKVIRLPFVLITRSPEPDARVQAYGPEKLVQILAKLDSEELRWEKIGVEDVEFLKGSPPPLG